LASTNNSKTPSRGRWIWRALALLAVLAILYSYLHQTPLKVRATTVQRGPIRSLVSTNGKIEPVKNFEAHAPIASFKTSAFSMESLRSADYMNPYSNFRMGLFSGL